MGTNFQSLIGVGIAIFILLILAFCVYVRGSQNRRCKGGICKSLVLDAENEPNTKKPLLLKENENNGSVEGVPQELHNSNVILIHGTLGNGVSKTVKLATNDVKKEFHFGITSESYKDCKSLHKYIKIMPGKDLVNIKNAATPPNQKYIVFEYVFLYLCAFHSLFKMQPKMVMRHCTWTLF